ncbi:MAG TPA: peptide ABC transporter permease [Deltaproteobacteria bacterium]|nr:peptide ABC transporter permease [Deltaproteobacteria bacterium]
MSALWKNPQARLGLVVFGLLMTMALVGPFFVGDPDAFVARPLAAPSMQHWLGTTGQGQDVLAQTVVGARTTLGLGVLVGVVVVAIGAVVGGMAGFFGGRVDELLSWFINVSLVLPGLPLMVILAAYLPAGPGSMAAVLVVTGWAWNARVVRSQVLSLRNRDFVDAAIVAGEAPLRVLVVEILPNMASLLGGAVIGATTYAIGAQVGLEFLGLGDLGAVTWGTNLYWATNDSALLTGSWWTFVPTGAAIALTGFSLSLLNFGLDGITNPVLAAGAGTGAAGPQPTPVRRSP